MICKPYMKALYKYTVYGSQIKLKTDNLKVNKITQNREKAML